PNAPRCRRNLGRYNGHARIRWPSHTHGPVLVGGKPRRASDAYCVCTLPFALLLWCRTRRRGLVAQDDSPIATWPGRQKSFGEVSRFRAYRPRGPGIDRSATPELEIDWLVHWLSACTRPNNKRPGSPTRKPKP